MSFENYEIKTPLAFAKKSKIVWFIIAISVLILVLLLPLPGLKISGHRALAIAAFAVIVWVSECVSYSLSAFIIISLITFLLGFAPDPTNPSQILGLAGGFKLAFGGWLEEMTWFMLGGLIISLSMTLTGLDKRIALWIVSLFKTARGVLIGSMLAMIALAFFMPPVVARTAAMVPIIIGIIKVFKQPLNSKLGAYLGIGMAVMGNTSAFGLLSGGSMNPLVASFVKKATGINVTWMQWFIWFFPYTIVMSIILYFVLNWMFKPEVTEVPGGKEMVKKMYSELGPWTSAQKRLLVIIIATVFCWAANGTLFKLDLTAITIVAITFLMTPGIGVIEWEKVQNKLPWGTVLLFATGIALGTVLLQTQAAVWLANGIFGACGLKGMSVILATIVFSLIGVILHLGFSSSTALCATYIPVVIAYITNCGRSDLSLVGIPLIILIGTGLTNLVVNTPNTMIAFQSGTFSTRQFTIVGIINTLLSLIMIAVFTATYWHWMGII